ncbi:unnamed protein product [Plutella xylostella]|uniref:(diamondback moth) hypothetical protein n=1 Tax=Plutella xylostella TaxID=51655 RepID=A0A8S4D3H9_PLUXY|nr:unnamed protein product [Plutella xylostella]
MSRSSHRASGGGTKIADDPRGDVGRKLEEGVQAPGLAQYKSSIEALIHNVVGMTPSKEVTSSRDAKPTTSNLLAAQEAVGRRVTQMFQQSKTNMNIPNIFKKKT